MMADAKFAKGPWRVNSMEFTAKRPQEVTFGVQAVGMEMDEANARLIAAAPELYEALEHILSGSLSLPRFAEEEALAAIKLARGEL